MITLGKNINWKNRSAGLTMIDAIISVAFLLILDNGLTPGAVLFMSLGRLIFVYLVWNLAYLVTKMLIKGDKFLSFVSMGAIFLLITLSVIGITILIEEPDLSMQSINITVKFLAPVVCSFLIIGYRVYRAGEP